MTTQRVRREPPPFRRVSVSGTESISPYMTRLMLGGPNLEGFRIDEPAASVRLLLPTGGELVIPTWNGNEFLLEDGSRPTIRTFTPRRFDAESLELHVDVVLHGSGLASTWAESAQPGNQVAVSGPGRGYRIDPEAAAFLLAGDESAIPAICQLLEHLPEVPIVVHLAVTHSDAIVDLHRDVDATWHVVADSSSAATALREAISTADLQAGARIWVAGEAAAMHGIRKHLFNERDFPRSQATVRGYWKEGR